MHPLMPDCTKFTDNELQEKIARLNHIMRISTNCYVSHQAFLMLGMLNEEQYRRNTEALVKANNSQDLDNIINIE